ncbi:hypothetical protein G6F66_014748 [Rhizopus arrhizus]|nr:hypothetical protein G6F66_014748 [Rhizopus arrhizus]
MEPQRSEEQPRCRHRGGLPLRQRRGWPGAVPAGRTCGSGPQADRRARRCGGTARQGGRHRHHGRHRRRALRQGPEGIVPAGQLAAPARWRRLPPRLG